MQAIQLTTPDAYKGVWGYNPELDVVCHATATWGEAEELVGKGSLAHFEMRKQWLIGEWSVATEQNPDLLQRGRDYVAARAAAQQKAEEAKRAQEEEWAREREIVLTVSQQTYTRADFARGSYVPALPTHEVERLKGMGYAVVLQPVRYHACTCGAFSKIRSLPTCATCGAELEPEPRQMYVCESQEECDE